MHSICFFYLDRLNGLTFNSTCSNSEENLLKNAQLILSTGVLVFHQLLQWSVTPDLQDLEDRQGIEQVTEVTSLKLPLEEAYVRDNVFLVDLDVLILLHQSWNVT